MNDPELDDLREDDGEAGRGSSPSTGVPLLPDPGFLWQVFRRNLSLFLIVVAAVLGLTVTFLALATPQYTTSASVLIQPSADVVQTRQSVDSEDVRDTDLIETQMRLLGSPTVAHVAAQLYAMRFASPDGDAYQPSEIEGLAARIQASVSVERNGRTSVIDIVSTNSDPIFAAAAANLVGEGYLQSQVAAKTEDSQSSESFINSRLGELQRNAIETRSALDNYKAARGLVGTTSGTNAEQEVSSLNQQIAAAKAELAEKRGRFSAARSQLARGGGGADVGAALGSSTIGSLRQQEARTSADLAMLTERYGTLHPERRQKERELRDIRQRIQEEINRVLSSLEADVQTAQSRLASLQSSHAQAMAALSANGRAQAGLGELEQKALAAQSIYQAFLERSQESEALRDSAMPDASFASRAEVPTSPSSPNYPLTIAAGIFMAGALGVFTILVAEYLRRGVQTKRDVERQLKLRYAGAIPSLRSTVKRRELDQAPHDYVIDHPHSLFAEAFRSVRTFLTLSPGARPRAIVITSALPREGKTTTSVCLARATAAEGTRTILVDADLRRRGASELIDFENEFDIFDYLSGRKPLADCIYRDPRSGLDVLGSIQPPEDSSNPLTEAKVRKLFDELRELYEVVIVDSAPILGVAESRLLAVAADRVLLITQWRKTSVRAVEAMADMLIEAGAKITGLALTQVNVRKYASTGDGDVYAYTKKFRGYYTS